MPLFGQQGSPVFARRPSRRETHQHEGLNQHSEDQINTFMTSFSSNGPTSARALPVVCCEGFFNADVRLSRSAKVFTHASSMWPSEILDTTTGETLNSSTIGPRAFSTAFLFSSRTFRPVDRAWRVSISADTAARSLRKLVRLDSTEFKMSSHARMDRWRSSNLALSFSTIMNQVYEYMRNSQANSG